MKLYNQHIDSLMYLPIMNTIGSQRSQYVIMTQSYGLGTKFSKIVIRPDEVISNDGIMGKYRYS